MVRKLPVIQTPSGPDAEAAERPTWQWVLIGAAFMVTLFLPLAMLGLAVGAKLASVGDRVPALPRLAPVPVWLGFVLAAWAAGALIGRFALRAPRRSAPVAGALGALIVVGFTLVRSATTELALVLVASGFLVASASAAAWLGARFGRRRRPA